MRRSTADRASRVRSRGRRSRPAARAGQGRARPLPPGLRRSCSSPSRTLTRKGATSRRGCRISGRTWCSRCCGGRTRGRWRRRRA
uniref:Uncharacterized protein n=1 Tax=Arundo donax TaxID=35708 RepID=A0A0A9CHI9_ARUDO